jgi:sRNA-binding protein
MTASQPSVETPKPAKVDVFPLLDKLAALYPQLFGTEFLPLKRGIFQDLLEAHPDLCERNQLKAALALHTRSTRYLTAVASGQQRHDLQGQAVEPMAPEHIYQALLEVFRRRQLRSKEDLRPKLLERVIQAFEDSSHTVMDYAALVHGKDPAANAMLDEALAQSQERAARGEALLRAFDSSGHTLEAFADMYGMDPRDVVRTLERARRGVKLAVAGSLQDAPVHQPGGDAA